jgi:hypothetical protein
MILYRGLFRWHVFDTRKTWFWLRPHPRLTRGIACGIRCDPPPPASAPAIRGLEAKLLDIMARVANLVRVT